MGLFTCMAIGIWVTVLQAYPFGGMTQNVKSPAPASTAGSPARKGPERTEKQKGSEPPKNAELKVVNVRRLVIAEKSLTIAYRLKNIFPEDIWVCEDIDSANRYTGRTAVETRIKNDTLRINLFGNLECNLTCRYGVWARYRRLPPGRSHSQTIHLTLPVNNYSPVYKAEALHRPKKSITLHQVTLTVGFFKGNLPRLLAQAKEREWPFFIPKGFDVVSYTPPKSKDPNVVFIPHPWEGTATLEQLTQIAIVDVNVPARVAANPKDTAEYSLTHKPQAEDKPKATVTNPEKNEKE
jgi:hypothetical protein